MKLLTVTLLLVIGLASGQIFTVAPAAISATAYIGGSNPTSRIVTLTVSGSNDYLSWFTSNQAQWISITPASGSILISSTFTVSFDISKLSVGSHSSIINVNLEGQSTPKLISVILTILEANCDERLTCDDCITSTRECGWCADPQNLTLGSCISASDSAQCNNTDWFPTDCPIPCTVPCIHGYCALSHGVCSCDFHYFGASCDIFCTPAINCSSEGICDSDGSCYCNQNYYGDSCQYKYCPGTVGDGCSNHGSCNNITGKCTCDDNYYGNDCSIFCNSTQCNHGSCSQSGQCACDTDYYGTHCTTFCDTATNCSNHGSCSYYGMCECYSGYFSSDCSVYCDFRKTCSSHGECIWNGTCFCNQPYYSENCELMHCPGYNVSSDIECFGNGVCNSAVGICICEENWFNSNCSVFCDQKSCSEHGTCSNEGKCICEEDYAGEFCSEKKNTGGKGGHGVVIGVTVTIAALIVIGALVAVFIKRRRSKQGYSLIQ